MMIKNKARKQRKCTQINIFLINFKSKGLSTHVLYKYIIIIYYILCINCIHKYYVYICKHIHIYKYVYIQIFIHSKLPLVPAIAKRRQMEVVNWQFNFVGPDWICKGKIFGRISCV